MMESKYDYAKKHGSIPTSSSSRMPPRDRVLQHPSAAATCAQPTTVELPSPAPARILDCLSIRIRHRRPDNYWAGSGQTNLSSKVTGISTDGTSLSCVYSACDDGEQILDMTQALGMAPGITGLYVYVGSTDTAIISAMTVTTDAPLSKQESCSWGWTPADASTLDPYFERWRRKARTSLPRRRQFHLSSPMKPGQRTMPTWFRSWHGPDNHQSGWPLGIGNRLDR